MKTIKEFLDEAKIKDEISRTKTKDGKGYFVVTMLPKDKWSPNNDKYMMYIVDMNNKVIKDIGTHPSDKGALAFAKNKGIIK